MKKLFQKSKLKNLYFGGFLFIIAAAFVVSCAKNDETTLIPTAKNNTLTATPREGQVAPHVENGMLSFNSYSDAKNFVADLKEKEQHRELINEAYTRLGINVNAETIPNLTDYPICLVAENELGHTSARKIEENRINEQLNTGGDVFSIIHNPYWKTILNREFSVRIGSRIFKYYDDGGIAIVLNNDWSLYESIKNKEFNELRQTHNLVITNDMMQEDLGNYFDLDAAGNIVEIKSIFLPRIYQVAKSNGKYTFFNASLIEGNTTYTWTYGDNTTSVGITPNRDLSLNETAILVIDNGTGTTTTVSASPLTCTIENFNITILPNCQIKVELPGFSSSTSPYTIKWVFSDGTVGTTNPFTKTGGGSGTVKCVMVRKSDGTDACFLTKPYDMGCCGIRRTRNFTRIFTDAGGSGQTWRLECQIWVQANEVGCSQRYLRRVLGVWVPAQSGGVSADIFGTYLRETTTNGKKDCKPVFVSDSRAFGVGIWPTSFSVTNADPANIFRDSNKLSSGHTLTINGVALGPGNGGLPRLILD
jgi:hypothetical protein